MAEVVTMPRLSDTMTDGTVAKWHKKVGEAVQEGDLLAEIETDKATMEFESFQEGTLLYIGVEEGASAPVDSILAILGDKDEDVQALIAGGAQPSSSSDKEAASIKESVAEDAISASPAPAPTVSSNGETRVKASPLARKMAEDKGFDLAQIHGSGDGGRIVKRDVESYTPSQTTPATATNRQEAFTGEFYEEFPVSQMRKTIARRLAESKFTAPHFYLTIDVDMDRAHNEREALKEAGVKVSFNDLVIKAAALALRKHPKVNSSWLGDRIRVNHHVHMGVAVAVDEGLLVPVVHHAEQKGLQQISSEMKDLASRAREGKLLPEEYQGGTFSISNLGMYGVKEFSAVINPPQGAILAVGAGEERPIIKDGAVTAATLMSCTLSVDHRVVDGAVGARFLSTFKGLIEDPLTMLL